MRIDGRSNDQVRSLKFDMGFVSNPYSSVLLSMGKTVVLCTASVDEVIPSFIKSKDKDEQHGWITAEYSMLPGATQQRFRRERGGRPLGGRTQEIQRLIGRSLRAVIDLKKLGIRTITVDCDVLQADGGTRTASINGAFAAVVVAIDKLMKAGKINSNPINSYVAAISCGVKNGDILVDLCYQEDFDTDVDLNVVMTNDERFLEIQGTAEHNPFTNSELQNVLELSQKAINSIIDVQKSSIEAYLTE